MYSKTEKVEAQIWNSAAVRPKTPSHKFHVYSIWHFAVYLVLKKKYTPAEHMLNTIHAFTATSHVLQTILWPFIQSDWS